MFQPDTIHFNPSLPECRPVWTSTPMPLTYMPDPRKYRIEKTVGGVTMAYEAPTIEEAVELMRKAGE